LAASNLVEVAEIVNRLLWRRCKPGFAEARVQCGTSGQGEANTKTSARQRSILKLLTRPF
jgi:hypothetical protein